MAFLHGFRFFLGFREGFLVDFLVLVERNSLNLHRDGRNHIGRLLVQDEVVQCLDVNWLIRHDIRGDELAAAFLLESLHGGVFDAGKLPDDALHLLKFDTEATDFHLSVLAPHKLDIARRQVAHNVAGAIDPVVFFLVVKRIGQIDLGGLFRPVEVTARHLRTRHPKFAGCPDGKSMPLFVNNVAFHVLLRLADGDVLTPVGHIVVGHVTDGLGRAIAIAHDIVRGRHQ